MFQIACIFQKCNKKLTKSLLFLRSWRLNLLREIVHIAAGIFVMGSQRVNKQIKIWNQTNADFFQLNISQMYGKIA